MWREMVHEELRTKSSTQGGVVEGGPWLAGEAGAPSSGGTLMSPRQHACSGQVVREKIFQRCRGVSQKKKAESSGGIYGIV